MRFIATILSITIRCVYLFLSSHFWPKIRVLLFIDEGKYIDFIYLEVKYLARDPTVTSATRGIKLSLFYNYSDTLENCGFAEQSRYTR